MSAAPPTPAERFAMFITSLSLAVAAHTGWDRRMSLTLISDIIARLRNIKRAVLRLAARVQAGRYRRRAVSPRPRTTSVQGIDPLPKQRNWLEPLLPEVVQYRGHLLDLLQDPEMLALITAAPEALGRPLRSLCRLLGLRPPPILARPARAAPAAKPPASTASKAPPPEPPRPQPPRLEPPAWMPRRTRWTLARIRGSPKPA